MSEANRVLVVDDNSHNRELLLEILSANGYTADEAASGEECLQIVRTSPPDIILLDVMMPMMDGFETCLRLQKAGFDSIPIIFMTAHSDGDSIQRAFEVGASDYISQPVRQAELLARLEIQFQKRLLLETLLEQNESLEQTVRDIKRKATHDAERLSMALEATGMGIWEWDIAQDTIYWSPETVKLFGLSAHSFGGKYTDYMNLVLEEDRLPLMQAVADVLANPKLHYEVEHRLIRPNGELCWMKAEGRVLVDSEGKPERLLGTIFDNTDHKLEDMVLMESQAILQAQTETLMTINQIANTLYQPLSVYELAIKAIDACCTYMGANSGAFYVLEGNLLRRIETLNVPERLRWMGATLELDSSFTGAMVRGGKMIISEDIGEDNRYVPSIQSYLVEMGIKRLISIPLIHNGVVLGAMNLGFTELSSLDADTRATLDTIGKTIGLSLANVRSMEQLRTEIAEREKAEHLQKVLFEISRATSRNENLAGLLAEIRSQIGGLLDSQNFFVALYDERKELYTFPFWQDNNDTLGWEKQKLTGSLTDYVRRRGAGAIIDRAEHDALIANGEALLIGTPAECWMGVPLKTPNKVIGVMAVQSYTDKHIYSQADLDLLSYVGENIAWVIENKRIEEELRASEATAREFQDKLQELLEISIELSLQETIDDVCRNAVIFGRERLGYDRMGLFLVDLEKDLLFGTFGTDSKGLLRDEREYLRPLSGEWSIARVIREGKRSYIWDNVPLKDDWREIGFGWNGMAVIWDGDKGIGSIAVDNLLSRQAIRPYEQELLGLYGIVLGYVISSKRAETARQRIVEHLRIVNSVEQAILAAASPRAIAEVVVERLEDFLHCDYVSIFSIDEESRMMHMLAWSVEDTGIRSFPLHEASLLDVERLEMGRTSVFGDLMQLANLSETENVLIGWGIRSFVIIPLLVDDILVGTLNLGMKSVDAFGEEQIAIAHEVATQLSVAIRQARLLEQVQAYASDLETQVKVRTEQLEAKASELEAFTYSVSHDLRQPLRAMSGFAEVLITDFAGDLNDEAKHYLERIRHNAQRMGTLIDDLLGLSRVGRRELAKTELAPESILREIVSELEGDGQIGKAAIHIQAMPSCKADPVLLKQLWSNLLTNAIKYSKKREQPEIIIGAKQERQEIIYFIQDNGVGFDMQYAEKLFGVFQRLHSSSEYEGTGIGLATVHRIVERHGGRIWAQAGIDKGASFFFVLGKHS